jgi:hypothetical protein
MCRRTPEGYKMNDGTDITYLIDAENISPEHILELNEAPATILETLYIRKSLHKLRNDVFETITNVFGELDKKIDELKDLISMHSNECPINRTEVECIAEGVANEKIEENESVTLKDRHNNPLHKKRTELMQEAVNGLDRFSRLEEEMERKKKEAELAEAKKEKKQHAIIAAYALGLAALQIIVPIIIDFLNRTHAIK